MERTARLAVAILTAAALVVAAAWALDKAQLPGWAASGGAAVATAYLAARSPLRRFATGLALWSRRLAAQHVLARLVGHVVEPVGTLARVVLPLASVPIVIVAFAARGLRVYEEVVVGAAIVGVVILIRRVEWLTIRRVSHWLRTPRGIWTTAVVMGVAYVVPSLVFLFVRPTGTLDRLERVGGGVTTLALVAVLVWLAAAVLRITAFAASPWRLLGLLPIAAAAARGTMAAGLVPGEGRAERVDAWLPLGGWLWLVIFLFGLALVIVVNHHHRESARPAWPQVAAVIEAIGFVGCVVAAAFFFAAVIRSQRASAEGRTVSEAVPEANGSPTTIELPTGEQALADMFSPILELHRDEQWPLTSVKAYLANVTLWGEGKRGRNVTVETLPRSCRSGGHKPCYVLRCAGTAGSCIRGHPVGSGGATRGVEYARVFRHGRDTDAAAFVPRVKIGKKLVSTIVQYWLFYAYDRWQAATAVGLLTQQHKGDWEAVTVGLAGDEPLFVAYSAHCGGRWYGWRDVEKRSLAPGEAPTHPVVAVALGSHANYANAAARRASDWGSCEHVPSDTASALTYTWNVRDRTSADYEIRPRRVVLVHPGDRRTGFAGRWGLTDTTVLKNERRLELGHGRGPQSPALQDLWRIPSWKIFKTAEWRRGR